MKSIASFMKWIPSVRRFPEDVSLVESINSVKETLVALATESRKNTIEIQSKLTSESVASGVEFAAIRAEIAAVRSESAAIRAELFDQAQITTAISSKLSSEFTAVRSELAAESAGLKKVILTAQTELGGLIRNIVKSNEDEVGATFKKKTTQS